MITFCGTLEADRASAYDTDTARWDAIGALCPQISDALVYWTDGSCKQTGTGAAVVWPQSSNPRRWAYRGYGLTPPNTTSHSAEIFGVAAALEIAMQCVGKNANIKIVRIFTDSLGLLQQLRKGFPGAPEAEMAGRPSALQTIFERAEWLDSRGVQVGLAWVKGHESSDGNIATDKVAGFAATFGYEEFAGENLDVDAEEPVVPSEQTRPIAAKGELRGEEMRAAVREVAEQRKGKGWDKRIYGRILKIEEDLEAQEDLVEEIRGKLAGLDDRVGGVADRRRRLEDELEGAEELEGEIYMAFKLKLREQLEEWDHPILAR